ncbi:hypothetical protein NX059_011815 [Plenodomus lindquistii]|nr:hypothetical protein NX059_011815 [Plenodomus lindquistii]
MLLRSKLVLSKSWPILGMATAAVFLVFLLHQTTVFRSEWVHELNKVDTSDQPIQDSPPELAIATFLTGQAIDDTYFNSTKLLAYQLLHDKPTRLTNPNITFVVMCGKKLSEDRKEALKRFGATVITLDDVELPKWIHSGEPRWSEQFTKLRAFQRIEYKRMLYIDADYLIMHPMDDIFEDPIIQITSPTLIDRSGEIKEDEGPLPPRWLFAARSENGGIGGFGHDVPPLSTNYANAGFFLIAPDESMYNHLMTVMKHEGRFSTTFMEQDMLNYVFRREGPMPWRELNWKWSANFVNDKDVEFGVHSLHGKFWWEGPVTVRRKWSQTMEKMIEFERNL